MTCRSLLTTRSSVFFWFALAFCGQTSRQSVQTN